MSDISKCNTPNVSVIIPTYNRAAYLREALASVTAQALEPGEIIVVDDGSTDETQQVVQATDFRIRYVRHTHRQGVAAARNRGLQEARGNIIAWLDSDDLWEPEFLATVVGWLTQNKGVDGAYTGITMIDTNGMKLGTATRVEPIETLYEALIRDCFLATPAFVAWRRCYDAVGGFDPQFSISEDYDMWLRLARRFRLVGIPKPLVRVRIHPANTMSDVQTLVEARLALVKKHFGELEREESPSENTKAAYGYAFRSAAIKYMEHGQAAIGWTYLEKAVNLFPNILQRLDTFYELALGDQPRGYRGRADLLDIPRNGAEMLQRLDALFASAAPSVQTLRGVAYGNAYLALAMLSDQAGDWAAARRYMRQAVKSYPALLRSGAHLRRLFKLHLGRQLISSLRRKRAERFVGVVN